MLFTWLVINCILVYLIIKKISQEKMDEYEVGLGLEKAHWRAGFALVIVVLVCLIAAWAVLTTGANPEAFSGRARYLSNAFLQPVFAALQMLILVVSSYVLFIPFVYYVGKFFKFLWRKV
jgi:hypothetical protein